jgi:hypothetical protein
MSKNLWVFLVLVAFIGLIVIIGVSDLEMPGADENVRSIANRYAEEVGAGERDPFINTDKGDLLLFMFAIGGAVAGFWLGYNWRDLFGKDRAVKFSKPEGECRASKS